MSKIDRTFLLGMPSEMLKRVSKEAKKLRLNKTQFIRRLIIRYFDEQEIKASLEARKSRE
jgi:Ribbon-helix-helix protein, copG family